jgi:phosphoribosyl 1,2-cyclic phosphodiesterase
MVIDDDALTANVIEQLLSHAGYAVTKTTDPGGAFDKVLETKPDCIICDLMMPEVDGLNLLKRIRETQDLKDAKFIMISAKAYDFDQKRAYEFGADGYIRKPLNTDTFTGEVERIIQDQIEMRFWGVRGTLPASGENTIKYGGNTSCVSLEFPRRQFFIFDGGTGIKRLGDWLLKQGRRKITARIFISHPHWDHINAIPFFAPLYIQGNEFQLLGANQDDISMRELISAQMEGVYFPITLSEFAARVYFDDLEEESLEVDSITVRTKLLSHPGKCLGYRVDYHGRSICYITDNQMFLETSEFYAPQYEERLIKFCHGADVLITDTTYIDEEYKTRVGWDHSCISKVVELAHRSETKKLYLFHHDPDQDDDAIDRKFDIAATVLKKRKSATEVVAPHEGASFRI